ncbi:MAG: hypothetical protein AAF970_07065 [Bacteroidota bacterium]
MLTTRAAPLHDATGALLRARWPEVANAFEVLNAAHTIERPTHTSERTLVVDGIQLTSGVDRLAEATSQATLIPEDSPEAWVYGVALGDLPRVLLRRPALQRLHVTILNAAVARAAFQLVDPMDWLSDDRVDLHLAGAGTSVNTPFAVAPAALQLTDEDAFALRDQLHTALDTPFLNLRHRQHATSDAFSARLAQTQHFWAHDLSTEALNGVAEGAPVLVVDAGKTLSALMPTLRGLAQSLPVVSTLHGAHQLVQHAVVPAVVAACPTDPAPVLSLPAAYPVPLVYPPGLDVDQLTAWTGPRLMAWPVRPAPALAQQRPDHAAAALTTDAGALTMAVDVALRMGAGCVVLFGADHLPDPATPGTVSVLNGYGGHVGLSDQARRRVRALEHLIQAHPAVPFVNASRHGVHLQPSSYLDEVTVV